jgi:hypothetical protein
MSRSRPCERQPLAMDFKSTITLFPGSWLNYWAYSFVEHVTFPALVDTL